jgi:hypothetical protein
VCTPARRSSAVRRRVPSARDTGPGAEDYGTVAGTPRTASGGLRVGVMSRAAVARSARGSHAEPAGAVLDARRGSRRRSCSALPSWRRRSAPLSSRTPSSASVCLPSASRTSPGPQGPMHAFDARLLEGIPHREAVGQAAVMAAGGTLRLPAVTWEQGTGAPGKRPRAGRARDPGRWRAARQRPRGGGRWSGIAARTGRRSCE